MRRFFIRCKEFVLGLPDKEVTGNQSIGGSLPALLRYGR
jgi:hypothetical protein